MAASLLPASHRRACCTAEDMLRYPVVVADREAVLPDFASTTQRGSRWRALPPAGGLPLAIELVAARVKPCAPSCSRCTAVAASTDGCATFRRQKTCAPSAGATLLRREQPFMYLSVFVGGFTLEAAELLCGDPSFPRSRSPSPHSGA
ncbi:MAG: hypothetical protein M9927_20160 [Anaerolineae bacterium]|nr:hypothetical protein [Anaerolineae bacterium]